VPFGALTLEFTEIIMCPSYPGDGEALAVMVEWLPTCSVAPVVVQAAGVIPFWACSLS